MALFWALAGLASAEERNNLKGVGLQQGAYVPGEVEGNTEAIDPSSSLSTATNPEFANRPANPNQPGSEAEQSTRTQREITRERRDWLAVGVQKLSGDYQTVSELSAEEEQELESLRESYYSPTMFVDHFARLENAEQVSRPEPMDWNAVDEPELSPEFDWFSDRSHQETVTGTIERRQPSRPNPYLQRQSSQTREYQPVTGAQPDRFSTNPIQRPTGTPALNEAKNSWVLPASKPEKSGVSLSTLPNSSGIGANQSTRVSPVQTPTSGPETTPIRRKEDISEKYFRDLDRF
ncbi:MAG: hypothetical protein AAFX93_01170 [Verrucomicrobiota bacterium]